MSCFVLFQQGVLYPQNLMEILNVHDVIRSQNSEKLTFLRLSQQSSGRPLPWKTLCRPSGLLASTSWHVLEGFVKKNSTRSHVCSRLQFLLKFSAM